MSTFINPYRDIHKAIRSLLSELLIKAGRTDSQDDNSVKALKSSFRQVQDLLTFHSEVEDKYLAPILLKHCNSAILSAIQSDHSEMHDLCDQLNRELDSPEFTTHSATAQQFYINLSRFIAIQFQHMAEEEETVWPILAEHSHDEDIIQVMAGIRAAASPEIMQASLRGMLSSCSPVECINLLNNMSPALDDDAFSSVLSLAQSLMPAADWKTVSSKLNTAPTTA